MRVIIFAAAVTLLAAQPLMAQTERGYMTGLGGFSVSPNGGGDSTSGQVAFEAGARVAPHLLAFGDLGRFDNLEPSVEQPTIDTSTQTAANGGLSITGKARVPAKYALAGVRLEMPTHARMSPYVFGGAGGARITPNGQFTYTSGILPDGSTPSAGTDVTSEVETAGYFTKPPATSAFMYTLGGGVDVPIGRHWAADVGYRFAHINTDTPTRSQGATAGFGYRF